MINVFAGDEEERLTQPEGVLPPFTVWTDTDDGEHDGRCVGMGDTLLSALIDAEKELRTDHDDIQARLTAERARLGELKHSDDRRG